MKRTWLCQSCCITRCAGNAGCADFVVARGERGVVHWFLEPMAQPSTILSRSPQDIYGQMKLEKVALWNASGAFSVSGAAVHKEAGGVAAFNPPDVIGHDQAGGFGAGFAGDMRGDGHVRMCPKSVALR